MRLLSAFLLSAMMAASAWAEETKKSPAFTWHAFKDAIPAAKASKKLIMVDIYTDW